MQDLTGKKLIRKKKKSSYTERFLSLFGCWEMKCSPFHATAKTSRITSWKRLESKTRSRRRLKRVQMKGILKPNKWFFTQVFRQNAPRSRSDVPDVAEGILKFFPGFNAFALSPPSTDPNVLNNPNTKKDQLQPQFLSELEQFKKMIKSMLVPKQSSTKGELVTGEGTCSCLYLSFLLSQSLARINTGNSNSNEICQLASFCGM